MASQVNKLSARRVETLTEPGRHSDGGGLYLAVSDTGAKSWVFAWVRSGKRNMVGLGSFKAVPLAKAREKAAEARQAVERGEDPRIVLKPASAAPAAVVTFGDEATAMMESLRPIWRSEVHSRQFENSLRTYAAEIWNRPIAVLNAVDIKNMLLPIWSEKHETATRVRERTERVFAHARAHGRYEGFNPAAWQGNLKDLLPKGKRVVSHNAALPFQLMPDFMAKLRSSYGQSYRLLEFIILTWVRTGEARGARWEEIDVTRRLWTVPGERMKAGKVHVVPLSDQVLRLLGNQNRPESGKGLVFPGPKGEELSNMAAAMRLRKLIVGMKHGETPVEATVHGFRSTARTWAGEVTDTPREVAEAALAHVVGNAVEQAYSRGDALEKRKGLMQAWADYCFSPVAPAIDATSLAA
ncbi:DUF4102 domain-containing protein [Phreatobacter aquaticus]|uniref:DUF4102 domain-containing protein n=1 Tax=Phreatobacter aquaticus TaxID=2570229 RepID=A0A4D7QNV5_9HYPH|nr:site-specific integrase [Phreatobacter aquaticus]QCK87236.1 DUF4102 domain-containing protein [Phreatobacter aquaticus]